MNSMESLFEKIEEQTESINSVLDFLKDTEKKRKDTDKAADTVKKSAAAAGGKVEGGGLLKGFSLKDISDNIVQLSKGLIMYARAEAKGAPTAFVKFLKDLQDVLTSQGALKNPAQIMKMYEAIGSAIMYMGAGLGKFALGLIMFAIPAKMKLTDLFIKFVQEFFSSKVMGKLDAKKAKEVGEALQTLAAGILKFAGYLMLATLAMVIGGPGLLIILPAIMLVMGVMSLFSKKAKDMEAGSKAIKEMALGLLIFTGALIIMRFVQAQDLLMALGVMAVFGLFVLMLGLIGKIIKGGMKGVKDAGMAVLEMSLGLVAFTLALIVMRFVQWEDILKAIVVVAVFGLFMYILGESSDVKKGAIAFLIISLSMLLLVFTIQQFKDIEWETILKAVGALAAVTLAVYIVGKNLKSALMGSIAILIVSISIGILAFTLKTWQDFQISDDTLIRVGLSIATIAGILMVMGIPPMNQFILLGAIALGVVAISLSISFLLIFMALDVFKKIGWTEEDSEAMSGALIAIPKAIMQGFLAGGGPLLFFAVPAVAFTGLAMYPIVAALDYFKKSGITVEDAEAASECVTGFINAIREPVEAVGKGGGLFAMSDFEAGVDAIDGLGELVAEIAEGVLKASKLEFKSLDGTIVKIKPADFVTVATNVAAMIDALKAPIMEIGANSTPAKSEGLLGFLGLSMVLPDDNDFRQGMKAISGIGELISEIAAGVLDMVKMEYKGLDGTIHKVTTADYTTVGQNVTALIEALKAPISEIGAASAKADTGIFGAIFGEKWFADATLPDDAYFAQGMEAVGGIGGLISGIATGVKDIAAGEFTDPADPKGAKVTALQLVPKVATVVTAMIEGLAKPISDIGKDSIETDTGVLGWLFGDSASADKIRTLKYGGFKEGMDAVGGIGSLLSGIASAIKTFGVGKLPDPSDPEGKTYIDVMTVVPKMVKVFGYVIRGMAAPIAQFSTMDEDAIDDANDKVTGVKKFVKALSDTVKSAVETVTAYEEAKTFNTALVQATTTVNTAAAALFKNKVFERTPSEVKSFGTMVTGITKIAGVADELTTAAAAMKSISESLVTVFTSLNTVLETKLTAVSTMLEKLVELDKVDAAELNKKVEAYDKYLNLIKNMTDQQIDALVKLESSTTTSMQDVFTSLTETLTDLKKGNDQVVYYLKKITKNTGLDAGSGGETA